MKVTLEIHEGAHITPNQVREAVVEYLCHHQGMNGKKANRRVKIIGVLLDVPLIMIGKEEGETESSPYYDTATGNYYNSKGEQLTNL